MFMKVNDYSNGRQNKTLKGYAVVTDDYDYDYINLKGEIIPWETDEWDYETERNKNAEDVAPVFKTLKEAFDFANQFHLDTTRIHLCSGDFTQSEYIELAKLNGLVISDKSDNSDTSESISNVRFTDSYGSSIFGDSY